MTMSTVARWTHLLAAVCTLLAAVALTGCPSADQKPIDSSGASPAGSKTAAAKSATAARSESPEKDLAKELEEVGEKPRDLGPPLVENVDRLRRLHPQQPVWIDPDRKQVVLQGEVCSAGYPLEFFATYSSKAYESVLSVNVTPSFVHAGLLLVGATAGHPAQFQPKFVAPTGTEIAIELRWKDEKGELQSAPAQHWVRNIKTKQELDSNWVFAGSIFVTDETTGKRFYQADAGDFICLLSLSTAMLDLPMRGYGALDARSFEAFAEHLPPPGTPVTLVLRPILSKSGTQGVVARPAAVEMPVTNKVREEFERKAVAAAEPWLALVDRGQYTRSWEMAAERFKSLVDRHDFIKSLNAARKPLGEVKSRELQSKQYATTLPGAPDGRYVVLQYKTTFVNQKSATETVTPMLEKDKVWKVSGYFIK
jgi:hypothetical protein